MILSVNNKNASCQSFSRTTYPSLSRGHMYYVVWLFWLAFLARLGHLIIDVAPPPIPHRVRVCINCIKLFRKTPAKTAKDRIRPGLTGKKQRFRRFRKQLRAANASHRVPQGPATFPPPQGHEGPATLFSFRRTGALYGTRKLPPHPPGRPVIHA